MFKLFDKAFWRFFSSFALILIVSLSILTIFSAWRETKENYEALKEAFTGNQSNR